MNHTEHTAKSPFRRTGSSPTLRAVLGDRGSSATSNALLVLAALIALGALLFAPAPAGAATRAKLAEISANPSGSGAGQLLNPSGGAVNLTGVGGVTEGDYYVADRGNNRVEQFHANGAFVAAFGLGVDQTTSGSVCTAASHDTCKAGEKGGAAGAVASPTGTAIDQANGNVYVYSLENRRVDVFSASGVYEGSFGWNVIPSGASGTGTIATGSTEITSVVTTSKAFLVGQTITGEGIPAGTTIVSVTTGVGAASKLKLSQAATESKAGDVLTVAAGPGNVPGNEKQRVTVASSATGGTFKLKFKTTSPNAEAETATVPYNATAEEVENAIKGLANVGSGNVAVTLDAGGNAGGGASPGGPWTVEFKGTRFADTNVEQMTVTANPTGGTVSVSILRDGGELEFCTAASGCLVGEGNGATLANGSAGEFVGTSNTRTLAVDSSGNVYVPNTGFLRLDEFSPTLNGSHEVTGVSFVRGIGWKVNANSPEEKLQICTTATGCQKGSGGSGAGQFTTENPVSAAVDSSGAIYAVSGARASGNCTAAEPCRIEKFNSDGTFKENFGPASGTCQLTFESGEAVKAEALAVAVDPNTQDLLALKKTNTSEAKVCELSSSGAEVNSFPENAFSVASAARAGLVVGIVDAGQTEPRVYAVNGSPAVYILGPVPPPSVELLPATTVRQTTAELNGKVTVPAPGGEGFDTRYHFEISDDGTHWTDVPTPDASAGSVAGTYEEHQLATGLKPATQYLVRLTAATGESVTSGEGSFSTLAPTPEAPTVSYALGANPLTDVISPFGATTAKLAGYVTPNYAATTYRFEYGTTTAYGSQSPAEFEPALGAGGEPVPAKASLSGLEPSTTYHFRIVASNASGTTFGADQQFTTAEAPQKLSSCGLPDNRCFELVSPADKGPVAAVEPTSEVFEIQTQAAPNGSAVAYTVSYGLPGTTTNPEVLYGAERGASGWSSNQFAPPALAPSEQRGGAAIAGLTKVLSNDLGCGVVASGSPLTGDAPITVVEAGGSNLYRRDNQTGAYAVITGEAPVNLSSANPGTPLTDTEYNVLAVNGDCSTVVFSTPYRYPGIAGPSVGSYIYEWHEGTLRVVNMVPSGGGEALAGATPGAGGSNYWRAVSVGASRVFFTATSQEGNDSGKQAVFVRIDGTETLDVSQSPLAVDTGATYEGASTDGSRVFFTANAGLTADSSAAGTDLYECHIVESGGGSACELGDLSVDHNPADTGGAAVANVLGVSADGSYVYFAARGQLVAGQGKTYAENQSDSTYNVYVRHGTDTRWVGTVSLGDLARKNSGSGSHVAVGERTTSRVALGGRAFLFQTVTSPTGYANAGGREAYLYSYDSNATVCLSCLPGGSPSPLTDEQEWPLAGSEGGGGVNREKVTITEDGRGGVRAFFTSPDVLVSGAIAGAKNLYEWEEGQTYLLVSLPAMGGSPYRTANADATDVYIGTANRLSWEDTDDRRDLYDLRVNGGFAQPPSPAPPCDPNTEGACQGSAVAVPSGAMPATSSFVGPGNEPAPKPAKHKHHKKKHEHQKKKHEHQKKKAKAKRNKRAQQANGNRRAGK